MTLAWQRRAAHLLLHRAVHAAVRGVDPPLRGEGRERAIGNDGQECLCRAGSVTCLPALHAAIAIAWMQAPGAGRARSRSLLLGRLHGSLDRTAPFHAER